MRMLCLALVCAAASVAVAESPTTVNRPSIIQRLRPLHRHPTMLSMLRRNNDIRRRVGLRPHRINPVLTKAAQDHANYMARSGDFQHYSNGGPQGRANKYGFRGGVLENIAFNYQGVEGAFGAWTSSGGHYASIVSNTSEAGFGYAVARNGATYWVGVYGNPAQGDAIGEPEGFAAAEEKKEAEAAKLAAEEAEKAEAKSLEEAKSEVAKPSDEEAETGEKAETPDLEA